MPVKMYVCIYNTALNISEKSKVVKQSSKFSSFMNQIYFELEFVFMSPHCASVTVSIHTSNELLDIYQFLLLCDHTMILCQWIALMYHVNSDRVLLEELSNRIMSTVTYSQHFCWFCLYCCVFEAFVMQVQYFWMCFYKYVGSSYGKHCSVFYVGHFSATRDVSQVRYQLPLWHYMNAVNYSHNHHLYRGTCASGKMVTQIP
jgi:hypothetical protein